MSIDTIGLEMIECHFEEVTRDIKIAQAAAMGIAALIEDELKSTPDLPWVRGKSSVRRLEYADIYGLNVLPIGLIETLRRMPPFESAQDTVLINHQPPGSKQGWHKDSGFRPPIYVIQLSPDGMFDYEGDDSQPVGLPVSVGDVLCLTSGRFQHRGRNPSDHDRYNIVLAKADRQYINTEE